MCDVTHPLEPKSTSDVRCDTSMTKCHSWKLLSQEKQIGIISLTFVRGDKLVRPFPPRHSLKYPCTVETKAISFYHLFCPYSLSFHHLNYLSYPTPLTLSNSPPKGKIKRASFQLLISSLFLHASLTHSCTKKSKNQISSHTHTSHYTLLLSVFSLTESYHSSFLSSLGLYFPSKTLFPLLFT